MQNMSTPFFYQNFALNNKSEQNTLINKKKYIVWYKTYKFTAFIIDIMVQFVYSKKFLPISQNQLLGT